MTPRMRRAARLLGLGYSQKEVARRVGVGDRTIREWLAKVDGFRDLAQASQDELADPSALDVLRDLLHSPTESIRLSAAKSLLYRPAWVPDPDAAPPPPPPGAVRATIKFDDPA
jgi:hypothetical protein